MSNKKFEGIIERLFVNDRKTAKGNKKSISIANNKVYYGLGLHDKETYEVDGVTLKEGMTVSFEYSDGQYKNVVLDTLKIVQQEVSKEVKKHQIDKSLPIRLGNALTVAQNFTKTYVDVVAIASKQVLPEVDKLRDKLAKQYTQLDDYALGARVGQCVVIAAQFTKDINVYVDVAEQLFHGMCRAEEELKESSEQPEKKVESTKPEIEPVKTVQLGSEPALDFDDEIPFAPVGLQYPQILNCM